jgi:iron complex transport system permease protein
LKISRNFRPYLLSAGLLAAALLLNVAVGAVFIPPGTAIRLLFEQVGWMGIERDWPDAFSVIIMRIRLPHAALIALAGAALGGSGAAYQGLFRNPLADPYLIGAASGAGLGAVLAMSIPEVTQVVGLYAVPAAAFVGALMTVSVVYFLARHNGSLPTTTLILAGVAVGSFASALTSFLMMRSHGELRRAVAWLLGGSTMSGWDPVWAALPYILAGLAVLLVSGHALNVLQFGDEQARQLGLPVERTKTILLGAATLATAAAVSFSGVIGFIGLIVPHLVRMLSGSDYRRLIPLSILAGAAALLTADLLARVALAPETLPVGVITALTGAPFFLWILHRSRGQVVEV